MNKKIIGIFIFLIFIGTSFIPCICGDEHSFSKTIYVNDDNTVGPWDGTQSHPYQFIQDGIDAAESGGTVFVYNGIYYENVVVNKTINLIGENRNETIIDGGEGEIGDAVFISQDYVNISHFTVTKGNYYFRDAGFDISGKHAIIFDNIITNNYHGIRLYNSSDNIIIDNTISDNINAGIELHFSLSNNTIMDNSISNNNFGIQIWSHFPIINSSDNTINGNIITNNSITDNNGDGITIFDFSDNIIKGNIITDNEGSGISIRTSSDNTIEGNAIKNNNEYGIILVYSSLNLVKENNFIKNKIQASFVTSDSNEWDYNYWNNWRVPFPKPILGLKEIPWWVTSLPIPWLNFDQNPVREPYDIPRI